MAHSAHLITKKATNAPIVTIRDDQDVTVTEWAPAGLDLDQIDEQLRVAGWTRSGEWASADNGWTAPVEHSLDNH